MPATDEMDKRTDRVNFRITPRERALIRAAARVRDVKEARYLVESACKQAEMDLADRRHFTLTAKKMEAFLTALDRPVQKKPRLRRLLSEPSILEGE